MKATENLAVLGLEPLLMTLTVSMFISCAPRVVSDMFTNKFEPVPPDSVCEILW